MQCSVVLFVLCFFFRRINNSSIYHEYTPASMLQLIKSVNVVGFCLATKKPFSTNYGIHQSSAKDTHTHTHTIHAPTIDWRLLHWKVDEAINAFNWNGNCSVAQDNRFQTFCCRLFNFLWCINIAFEYAIEKTTKNEKTRVKNQNEIDRRALSTNDNGNCNGIGGVKHILQNWLWIKATSFRWQIVCWLVWQKWNCMCIHTKGTS